MIVVLLSNQHDVKNQVGYVFIRCFHLNFMSVCLCIYIVKSDSIHGSKALTSLDDFNKVSLQF